MLCRFGKSLCCLLVSLLGMISPESLLVEEMPWTPTEVILDYFHAMDSHIIGIRAGLRYARAAMALVSCIHTSGHEKATARPILAKRHFK